MVLTGIMREEEKRMKKNEKQIIISLGVVIAVNLMRVNLYLKKMQGNQETI